MEKTLETTAGQQVVLATGAPEASPGSAGLNTQLGGVPTTVSGVSSATGGIGAGNLIMPDIDKDLFVFESEETPLMSLMLQAKNVSVSSPEVMHFMVDEQRAIIYTKGQVNANPSANRAILPLEGRDQSLAQAHTTLLLPGVDGYTEDGKTVTKGKPLMLLVVGHDPTTNNPLVVPVNGPRAQATDEVCTIPAIPAGSEVVVMSTALSETQKEVSPDTIVPQPRLVYLQKRGMTSIVSHYFDAQKKLIPFTEAMIAEHQIRNFKRKGNRTLLASRKGKIKVDAGKMGKQFLYTTEGVRWQVQKEFNRSGARWSYEEFVALAKMFFTGEDVPNKAILVCGKNVLEAIQSLDFSKHPHVKMEVTENEFGWAVTRIKTVFGNIDVKRDPSFDAVGWENSALLLDYGRLVHYTYKSETEYKDDVEGHEASSESIIVWDGLALKGTCHIWVNGDGTGEVASGATTFMTWGESTAPDSPKEGMVYYLLVDCKGIHAQAKAGQMWQYKDSAWKEYTGLINAGDK